MGVSDFETPIRNGAPVDPMRPIKASSGAPESGQSAPVTVVEDCPAAVSATPALLHVPPAVSVTGWPAVSVTPVDCHIPSTPGTPGGGVAAARTETAVQPGGRVKAD